MNLKKFILKRIKKIKIQVLIVNINNKEPFEFYWFNVLKNNTNFKKIIQETDEIALKFLTKI